MSAPQIQTGPGMRLTHTGAGTLFSAGSRSRARHPWWTSSWWDALEKKWFANVLPGYVNGRCPVVWITLEQAKSADYGINPLSGEPYFSAWVFQNPKEPTPDRIPVPLYSLPKIPLQFRNLGWDGGSDVPQFFLDRGVAIQPPAPSPLNMDAYLEWLNNQPERPKGMRLLRAADIVLHQPRLALTSEIELNPAGVLTGQGIVRQTLSLRSPAAGDRLKIYSSSKWNPPQNFGGATNLFADNYEEPNFDERLVSTVYLLSPPDAPPFSEPDATWTPFVRHSLFWNLNWAQPEFRYRPPEATVLPVLPLAGGVAQIAIGFLQSSMNDMYAGAWNILQAHSMAGSFWACTGGGHDSRFPTVAPEAPEGKTGLDAASRLAAKRAAEALARRQQALDPEFPYHAPAFDLKLLSA